MKPLRVLVVDDSAFARKVLRESLLARSEFEVVATARDGIDALEKISMLAPDVITLDLVMPNLDGVGVLRALSEQQRRRTVIVSMADGESELGVQALSLGAFDLVHKPTALAIDSLREIADELVSKVLLAGQAPARAIAPPLPPPPTEPGRVSQRVVLVGTSTGGPQALSQLLRALPADFPAPIVIVLHIPAGYTAPFAARLDGECAIEVVEAEDGALLRPGLAIVARAGMHLSLVEGGSYGRVRLTSTPVTSLHRPSVDVLFASAAQTLGARALGVVLTGMGEDGLAGARQLVAAGAEVLTEAEASCVVYGMPRAVKNAGLSSADVPLARIAYEIAARL